MRECKRECWAAEQALDRLQRKLEKMKGWRASIAWEAVEHAQQVLGEGMWEAWNLDAMPSNFRHWRDKYVRDEDML